MRLGFSNMVFFNFFFEVFSYSYLGVFGWLYNFIGGLGFYWGYFMGGLL